MRNRKRGSKQLQKMFRRNLIFAFEAKEISVKELAQKMDMTLPTVYGWLNGASYPSYDMLKLLAETLDVTTDFLLCVGQNLEG